MELVFLALWIEYDFVTASMNSTQWRWHCMTSGLDCKREPDLTLTLSFLGCSSLPSSHHVSEAAQVTGGGQTLVFRPVAPPNSWHQLPNVRAKELSVSSPSLWDPTFGPRHCKEKPFSVLHINMWTHRFCEDNNAVRLFCITKFRKKLLLHLSNQNTELTV